MACNIAARLFRASTVLVVMLIVGCGGMATGSNGLVTSPSVTPPNPGPTIFLTDAIRQELGIELLPIPEGAPPAVIDQEAAVSIAGDAFGRADTPPVIEHGLGKVKEGESATVWLVVYPIENALPQPGGPSCQGSDHAASLVVINMQGAFVSDQTGRILTSFDHGYRIASASPCPTVPG
jgi:hypothetical protein